MSYLTHKTPYGEVLVSAGEIIIPNATADRIVTASRRDYSGMVDLTWVEYVQTARGFAADWLQGSREDAKTLTEAVAMYLDEQGYLKGARGK